jgi:dephospho-CoA kinase/inosine/xanthosine triphosphate pyrophosphatase family protein
MSALSQWKKRLRRSDDGASTFFFEDTSVKIAALSHDVETPGVNVKFWMKEMTFNKLDEILKRHGNDRRVSVRSDIVMHLPQKWKGLLGTQQDFLWFCGETQGEVTNVERHIDSNLLFTWLDDRSFNRWFVPDGESLPLSALKISVADKYDFRLRAFQKMEAVLKKLSFVRPTFQTAIQQMELPVIPAAPAVIVICGPSCAGKTTTATWINDVYGIPHIEASDFMYKAFWERHGLRSKHAIVDFAVAALESEPSIVASPIANYIAERGFNSVVVTGFRSLNEVHIFQAELPFNMKVELIYIDAVAEIRLERAIKRNRDKVTPERFFARDEKEVKMGLLGIRENSASLHIENNSTVKKLGSMIEKKLKSTFDLGCLWASTEKFDSNLEALIIMALFENAGSLNWMNTSEVAASLNEIFGEKKSKTNVSRYFNQEYHPYFEARLRTYEGRSTTMIEYSLSATGISRAKGLKNNYAKWLSRKLPGKSTIVQLSLFANAD